jgi:hypothetical protein
MRYIRSIIIALTILIMNIIWIPEIPNEIEDVGLISIAIYGLVNMTYGYILMEVILRDGNKLK